MLRLRILWLCLILCLPLGLRAEEYRLFSVTGEAHAEYNNILPLLKQDDVLVFSGGEKFKLQGILGHGNTTLVLKGVFEGDVQNSVALRVPLFQGYFGLYNNLDFERRGSDLQSYKGIARKRIQQQDAALKTRTSRTYTDFLNSMLNTQKEFESLGAPVLPIIKGRANEYAAVPVIPADPVTGRILSLDKFLSEPALKSRFPEARQKLDELSRSLARVSDIGDFGLRQILYDFEGKRWILNDWLGYPGNSRGLNAFSSGAHPLIVAISHHDIKLSERLRVIMDQEKARLRGPGGCTQFFRSFFFGL